MSEAASSIHVLHVDDDADFAEMAAVFLEREDDRVVVETATSAGEALDVLDDAIDCVVSDYDMPARNGIEFLQVVRERYPDLPFILFTGKGSEEVASEAISAGVTDYLQKGTGRSQYAVLANRIANTVEQYRTKQRADQVEQEYRLVAESASDAFWTFDPATGEIRMAGLQNFGYDTYEAERDWWVERLHPEDRERVLEQDDALLADDAAAFDDLEADRGWFSTEYRWRRQDGTYADCLERGVVLFEEGEPTKMVGTMTDVSEQKSYQRTLEQRTAELQELTTQLEEQYRYLFEEAPVMAVVTRSEDGGPVIDDCNQLFAETLGYEKDALVGRRLAEFYTPHSRQKLLDWDGYERALTGEFVREDRELVTADGETVETLLRAVPRREADHSSGTLAFYIDISERRALEREKERLEAFTRIVSHDLRNPLNVAQARTELARETGEDEHLDAVTRAHDRMAALIDDLLTLARSGEQLRAVEPVALGRLVEGCWENVETADATLVVDVDRAVQADRSRLEQLFENLIRNAVEHGPTSSRSTTDDAAEGGSAGVTVVVGELEDEDGFYVADDGPGIPEAERDAVFDAGYSTDPESTGFGLNIVEEIATAHGWTLTLTESADGGARFECAGVEYVDD